MTIRRAVGLQGSVRRASRRMYRRERPIDVWRRRTLRVALALALGAIAVRAALPTVVKFTARRTLAADGWKASVDRASVSLWRASWTLHDVRVEAPDGGIALSCDEIVFSLSAPSFKLGRPSARLALVDPRVRVGRPVAAAELADRLRRLTADSVVDWRVENGTLDWPLAGGQHAARFTRVHGTGRSVDAGRGSRRSGAISGLEGAAGRAGLAFSEREGGTLVRASGSGLALPRIPARFVLALEAGEAGALLAGPEGGELEPQPLLVPGAAGAAEASAAAFSQALEAATRVAPAPAPRRKTSGRARPG